MTSDNEAKKISRPIDNALAALDEWQLEKFLPIYQELMDTFLKRIRNPTESDLEDDLPDETNPSLSIPP